MEQKGNKISALHVTTGYPRKSGDVFGSFIAESNQILCKKVDLTVLAPGDHFAPNIERNDQLTIKRFSYWPFGLNKVAYGQGIPTNLKSWGCRIQLPFFLLVFVWKIFVESKGKDLIHAHWGISGVLSFFAAKTRRIPLVVSFHGSDLHGSPIIQKASRWIAKKSDLNICVSKEQAEILDAPCQLVSYPVDTQRFLPVEKEEQIKIKTSLNLPIGVPLILMVGYLIPLKRFDLAVQALSLMDDGHLVIAGEGNEKAYLERLIREKGLSKRVSFLGSVPYHEIHKVFQIADLHFLCSEREGKPNVVYQAMASGVPSLSTSVGGVPEQIVDNITGCLLEDQAESFAITATHLINHPNEREEMGFQARKRLQTFGIDPSSIALQIEELYKKLI